MREVVVDTETTGLDPSEGHRIVEIGAVELVGHLPTGRTYQQYINPERAMPEGAFAVHGLSDEFLRDKPVFAKIGAAFIDFIGDSKLVIHNASFDMKFLNAELKWMDAGVIPFDQAIDSLAIARKKFPGAPASLDALCRRFGVDNSAREKHGALLDSEILAEVYLELIGGRQPDFGLSEVVGAHADSAAHSSGPTKRPTPLPPRLTDAERAAHAAFIETLGDKPIWKKFG